MAAVHAPLIADSLASALRADAHYAASLVGYARERLRRELRVEAPAALFARGHAARIGLCAQRAARGIEGRLAHRVPNQRGSAPLVARAAREHREAMARTGRKRVAGLVARVTVVQHADAIIELHGARAERDERARRQLAQRVLRARELRQPCSVTN